MHLDKLRAELLLAKGGHFDLWLWLRLRFRLNAAAAGSCQKSQFLAYTQLGTALKWLRPGSAWVHGHALSSTRVHISGLGLLGRKPSAIHASACACRQGFSTLKITV